ncbi:MAG TPA: DUF4340 domain-containing protein [Cyclobacteriaceae bacterium]|jgi:hypothetical protein
MKLTNTHILAAIFFVLVAGFVVTRVFRSPARMSNIEAAALKVDTAAVTEIRILRNSATDSTEKVLTRNNGTWRVEQSGINTSADAYSVSRLLESLANMEFDRIVTRNKDKWEDYGVTDDDGIVVNVSGASGELATFVLGAPRGGEAFVRKGDANEVYTVNASVHSTFGRDFNSFRNKTFLKVPKDLVLRMDFRYPADSGFVVERKDNKWMIGDTPADSAKVESFLNTLRSRNLNAFADDFVPSGDPDLSLVVSGNSGDLETVRAWRQPDATWRLASTVQPDVYFSDSGTRIIADLFRKREDFLAETN